MLEQMIRKHFQKWLVDPIAHTIKLYITPTSLTIFGGILGICVAPALAFQYMYLAVMLLLLSGYIDILDGTVARMTNQCSEFGSALDIIIDRSVEFATILGLWLAHPDDRSLLCLIMLGCMLLCVTSFLVVGIFTLNQSQKSFFYSPGIIERPEAFMFFILMIFIPAHFFILASVFSILTIITTINRMYEFS